MPTDQYYRYDEFEAFSLPARGLNHPWELLVPPELVSHDVNQSEWSVRPCPLFAMWDPF